MQTDMQPEPAPELIERAKAMLAGSYAYNADGENKKPGGAGLRFGQAWDKAAKTTQAFYIGVAQRMADSPTPKPYMPPPKRGKKATEQVDA